MFFSVKPRPQLNGYNSTLHSHCNRIMTQRLKVTNALASKIVITLEQFSAAVICIIRLDVFDLGLEKAAVREFEGKL